MRLTRIDDAILAILRPRHCLLLLDNCEHLVEPVAALVVELAPPWLPKPPPKFMS